MNYENILYFFGGLLAYLLLSWIWAACFEGASDEIERERLEREALRFRIEIPSTRTPLEYPERFTKFKQDNERWDR